ncbi:unnamed protein product [Acanthoscelides obtectus]|nr:unnamed protein product [Acanthoscelides obtectus]CAK1677217.1 Zinc finger and SCAN domain-containing protein 22 [Acanthoscelides obtectus]
MEQTNIEITDKTCRLCLGTKATSCINSMNKSTSKKYSYIVENCLSLKVDDAEDFPQKICLKCIKLLVSFYKFKNTVLESDKRLHEILAQEDKADQENTNHKIGPSEVINATVPIVEPIKAENFDFDEISVRDDSLYNSSESEAEIEDKSREKIPINKCEICGKFLSCKSNLTQHIRRHTGERPFACDVCGKKFFKAEHASIHKRIHTGERPHKCLICSRRFIQYAALKVHIRTHTGERPHQCPTCGKAFSQPSSLVYHQRTHSGETPFHCTLCGKGFKNSGNLKIHIR